MDALVKGWAGKKEIRSWYLYDWACSAFSATVITVLMGPYLSTIAENAAVANSSTYIYPFGIQILPGSLFAYVISVSVILQVFALPFLGAVADFTHRKKDIMLGAAAVGSLATVCMFFIVDTAYLLGAMLLIISNFSYGVSIVMYNAYLNDIAPKEERDTISSKGFAWGYLGGGLLLLVNLALITFHESLGIGKGMAVRISLSSAGVWWLLFSIFPLRNLRKYKPTRNVPEGKTLVGTGFSSIKSTLRDLKKYPKAVSFLLAYLFYNDGVQAVIAMASVYGSKEVGMDESQLIGAILMVQVVAIFGALGFNKVAKLSGTLNAILFSIIIWLAAVVYAYLLLDTAVDFYIMAFVVALVMGGSQALSRSLFSRLIPEEKEAEFFGFYEISERGTSWIGTALFGIVLQLSGSYRYAILSLVVFFVIGIILLLRMRSRYREAV
ncbi:MAG: MFS transporter [Candidatus Kapaibacteriales bacterium]